MPDLTVKSCRLRSSEGVNKTFFLEVLESSNSLSVYKKNIISRRIKIFIMKTPLLTQ
jgi:hypothetical protein